MVSFYAQLKQLILFRRCLFFAPIMARTDKYTRHSLNLIVSYLQYLHIIQYQTDVPFNSSNGDHLHITPVVWKYVF